MDPYTIKLDATHSQLEINLAEIRFDRRHTILEVKENLAKRFGTNAGSISLQLRDGSNNPICIMGDDSESLGHYSPQEGYIIHVIDSNATSILKDLNDVSKVEKYEISEEDYLKRPDNFRKYKEKIVEQNPSLVKPKIADDYLAEEAKEVKEGDRCLTIIGERRGTVKYVGKVKELQNGYWVGVQLDEPAGENDGSIKGTKYFECGGKYGIFLRPNQLKVGDYPVEDLFNAEEDEI